MEYIEFEKMFHEELLKNNINEYKNVNKFYNYMKLILEWNKKINLTAIKDEKDFIIKHFIDSLTINKYIKNSTSIIDVGTGAGFPGLPIKLFHEEQLVTLIDSVGKKINVLNDIIRKLDLKGIEAIHDRAENYVQIKREYYDIAVSRAVSNMNTLVEYLIPYVKLGGSIICMKGPNIEDELKMSENAIKILGGKIEKIDKLLIDESIERNIIIIRKYKNTPLKYPRGQNKPLKEPLK